MALALSTSLLFLSGCGVYSKAPPVNPEQNQWEGPLLDSNDLDHVQIYVKPSQKTIVLNLSDLNADLRMFLSLYQHTENQNLDNAALLEQFVVDIPQTGDYVLIIEKDSQE